MTLHHNEKMASEAAVGCTGVPSQPSTFRRNAVLHKPVLKCLPEMSGAPWSSDLSKATFGLLLNPSFDGGFQVLLADLIWICSLTAKWTNPKRLPKNQSSTKTSENEPNWTSSPIPSQGNINYAFTPLFGMDSNFSLSSDHNSLYFNTAINNDFEVEFKIF